MLLHSRLSSRIQDTALSATASFLIGITAWHSSMPTYSIAATPLVLILWMLSSCRQVAFLSLLPYLLYAGRDVPTVIARYTELNLFACWSIIVVYSTAISTLFAIGWHQKFEHRAARLLIVLILITLPPAGSLIYASPLTGAGFLFPNIGILGLGLTWLIAVCVALGIKQSRREAWLGVLLCMVVALFSHAQSSSVQLQALRMQNYMHTVNTSFGRYPDSLELQWERQETLQAIAKREINGPASIIVLPEEVAGLKQPRFEWTWDELGLQYAKVGKTLLIGKDVQYSPVRFRNSLVAYGKQSQETYASSPVPIGSWRPWADSVNAHFPAQWFHSAKIETDQGHINVFFCWEELMMWPWLWSSIENPEPMTSLTVVNHWFAEGLSITDSQARSAQSMAKLYGWTLARSINRPR